MTKKVLIFDFFFFFLHVLLLCQCYFTVVAGNVWVNGWVVLGCGECDWGYICHFVIMGDLGLGVGSALVHV